MSDNVQKRAEPFVKLPRELIASDAWRSLGINARRFIDFLFLEHMAHGGKENGKLQAPYRQLITFGVSSRRTAAAIREAEEFGLVDCHRGGMRVATTYALTWLPLHNGTAASNRWRAYRNPDLAPMPTPKSKNLPDKGSAALPDKVSADGVNLPDKVGADRPKKPKILPDKVSALSRRSYQGGANSLDIERRPAAVTVTRLRTARAYPDD